ncbi:type II toxin-antitoxin system Phd/YefM family antitoxin [Curtobacterium sp. Leaf261]|uniref:type II toxin-antitoxin system Phd/YefM family antitoxin n=1 Tax=Curtobacterium sp. Leaf261 TaxID=1736311 RepID=UPI0006FC5B5B|nr:type II toxin-antitoxin system Phd/YefM family antitoxin [Curtobacterium sp. Leaf261]KQO64942.1 antitoxin PHD [Curtobacterium sp. Leaf261]
MNSISASVSTRELRADLASVMGRAGFGHERIAVTRNGKVAAVVIGTEDLELLERLENAADLAAYNAGKAADDGSRISLADLRSEE